MKDNLTFKKSRKALLKLLEKKDYDEISVADIVKECGFSRQNFYKNFSNKDELFKSIFMYDIKKALDREILYEFGKTSINIIDIISENKNLYLSVLYSSLYCQKKERLYQLSFSSSYHHTLHATHISHFY